LRERAAAWDLKFDNEEPASWAPLERQAERAKPPAQARMAISGPVSTSPAENTPGTLVMYEDLSTAKVFQRVGCKPLASVTKLVSGR